MVDNPTAEHQIVLKNYQKFLDGRLSKPKRSPHESPEHSPRSPRLDQSSPDFKELRHDKGSNQHLKADAIATALSHTLSSNNIQGIDKLNPYKKKSSDGSSSFLGKIGSLALSPTNRSRDVVNKEKLIKAYGTSPTVRASPRV